MARVILETLRIVAEDSEEVSAIMDIIKSLAEDNGEHKFSPASTDRSISYC